MTTVDNNTFTGPNQGDVDGYDPHTLIQSSKIDADLIQIKNDLDYHFAVLQNIYSKLDTIESGATADLTADEIVTLINASTARIDVDNLNSAVATLTSVASSIESHRSTTINGEMHPQTSIKNTGLTYSQTPVSLITSCVNLLDEIKNLRYQVHKINGKANWTDSPDSTITSLKSLLTSTTNSLNSHIEDLSKHLTSDQNAAIDGANAPSGSNVFVTMDDIAALGGGDMLKSIYDPNSDGSVLQSDSISDGVGGTKTYSDIAAEIDSDIVDHSGVADAHHTRYSNSEAINAINTDTDHGSTAQHDYRTDEEIQDVAAAMITAGSNISKSYDDANGRLTISATVPSYPADSFTQTEVTNLKGSKLSGLYETIVTKNANYTVGSSDYTILADAAGGSITITLPSASSASGRILNIKKIDSSINAVTVDANGSETIDGQASIVIDAQYDSYSLMCDGSNWWII